MLHARLPSVTSRPLVHLTTALLWGAAAASVAYAVLHFPQGASLAPVPLASPSAGAVSAPADVARALGAAAAAPASAAPEVSRYQLLGVIASGKGEGSALIGIDGQPPKAFRVGQTVAPGVLLQGLSARQARLGTQMGGPTLSTLALPGPGKAP